MTITKMVAPIAPSDVGKIINDKKINYTTYLHLLSIELVLDSTAVVSKGITTVVVVLVIDVVLPIYL